MTVHRANLRAPVVVTTGETLKLDALLAEDKKRETQALVALVILSGLSFLFGLAIGLIISVVTQ